MPPEWAVVTAAELEEQGVLLVQDGNHGENRPRPDEFEPTGTPFIRAADISGGRVDFEGAERINATARDRVRKGIGKPRDVLLSHKGTVGRVAMVSDDAGSFVCSPQTTFWRSLDETTLSSRFLYALIRSPFLQRQLESRMNESDMAAYVSLTVQRTLKLLLPPITEQRRIAAVVGVFDDKISHNDRMCVGLEEFGQLHFHQLIGRYLDDVDSAPAEYDKAHLVDVFDLNPKRSLKGVATAPYLDMKNMPTRGHHPDAWADREVGSGTKFQNGDTLVARITPCLENGKSAFVDFLAPGEVGWGSTEYIVLRPKTPLREEVAYFLARNRSFRDFAVQHMIGTSGRQRVSAGDLGLFPVALPLSNEMSKLGELLTRVLATIRGLREESRRLTATRDVLLPSLLTRDLVVAPGYDPEPILGSFDPPSTHLTEPLVAAS